LLGQPWLVMRCADVPQRWRARRVSFGGPHERGAARRRTRLAALSLRRTPPVLAQQPDQPVELVSLGGALLKPVAGVGAIVADGGGVGGDVRQRQLGRLPVGQPEGGGGGGGQERQREPQEAGGSSGAAAARCPHRRARINRRR